jgi:transcriptional regulator with XRE-family HTH domain
MFFLDDAGMNDTETFAALGRLIVEAREERYPSRRQFAQAAGMDIKTVVTAEKGVRELHPHTQRRIEQALGWRKGAIHDVWQHRTEIPAESLTVQEMERGAGEETWEDLEAKATQVSRASQLTDEELLAELSYRFRNYKIRLNGES